MTDHSSAELQAISRQFNRMLLKDFIAHAVAEMNGLCALLRERNLLGVNLLARAAESPFSFALPLIGLNVVPGCDAVPLLLSDLTVPLLCQGHFLKAVHDAVKFGKSFHDVRMKGETNISSIYMYVLSNIICS